LIDPDDFQPLFHPRSVAVIGASNDAIKFGGQTYSAMKARRYRGRLYAVNPSATEVDGDRAYARVQDIPEQVDMAIVAVAAPHVVRAVADCMEKRVRAVQILTAGFREGGSAEGARWEEQIAQIARESGMRIVGPNCFGRTGLPQRSRPGGRPLPERWPRFVSDPQGDWPRNSLQQGGELRQRL
jgi:acyl-CoA synthetase (NDP forming)